MKHPSEKCQKNQEEFLKKCPEGEREFHAQLFRIGNATYRYHQLASQPDIKSLRLYYEEWLEGLPKNIQVAMRNQGFEACQNHIPFTRYVNERTDIGMDEWLKQHLSQEDYKAWSEQGKTRTINR